MNYNLPQSLTESDFQSIRDLIIKDIEAHAEWREEVSRGKMFGFMVVEPTPSLPKGGSPPPWGELEGVSIFNLQYIKAYSGQILGRSDWEGYVPAIFDYLQPDGYFKIHEAEITALNHRIKEAEALLPKGKRTKEVEAMKQERKERSQALQRWLFSQFVITPPPTPQEDNNTDGEASVLKVFTDYAQRTGSRQTVPPGGTGECCAPKLLNYANQHGLKVKAIAEFWYGDSPKGIIRHHGQFYEPCQAKCMPILWYMLPKDCKVYPFMRNPPEGEIRILWQDEWFVAIDKPAGLLSVPGKRNLPNAQALLNSQFSIFNFSFADPLDTSQQSEPLRRSDIGSTVKGRSRRAFNSKFIKAVHRLDMDTSGILLFAKTEEAFVKMQGLFAEHKEVHKEYVAVLSKPESYNTPLSPREGTGVSLLPLSPDFENRPMQKVDYEEGKEAITRYEFIDQDRVRLFPLTGRTHQLRIHCAHPDGLNRPILGDPLYGNTPADRMYLHATRLSFTHPFTGGRIEITSPTPF
ncbi:MAG: RluA family pseudouridine synthase [Prevotella sp.]|nr:RluA family pseudouridine synthase [Prevotella sp.]